MAEKMKEDVPEIRKVMVLSTAHLSKDTCLNYQKWPFIADFEYGCYFFIGDTPATSYPDAPKDLQTVLVFAKKHGCTEVKFDQDGPVLAQLPVYPDWDD